MIKNFNEWLNEGGSEFSTVTLQAKISCKQYDEQTKKYLDASELIQKLKKSDIAKKVAYEIETSGTDHMSYCDEIALYFSNPKNILSFTSTSITMHLEAPYSKEEIEEALSNLSEEGDVAADWESKGTNGNELVSRIVISFNGAKIS